MAGAESGRAERACRTIAARRVRRAAFWGVAAYLLVAALLYSFLTPGFPGDDGLLVFGVAIVGLVVATLADILPGDRYVRRRYRAHGTFRVALWTLVLAAGACSSAGWRTSTPGYMYGIIGTFTFAVALSRGPTRGGWRRAAPFGLLMLALVVVVRAHPVRAHTGRPASRGRC